MKKSQGLLLILLVIGGLGALVWKNWNQAYEWTSSAIYQTTFSLEPSEKLSGIPVLLYHHILEDRENKKFRYNEEVITPEQFRKEMELLHYEGYTTVTLRQLEDYLDRKAFLPAKSIVITFDDGYLSNYKYAYPILKKYHDHAAIFAITEDVRRIPDVFNPDKLNYISWEEISRYSDVFDVEAHAHHFHRVRGLGTSYLLSEPSDAVKKDLAISKSLTHASYFAYPYGQYNDNTIRILKELGFRMAFTIKAGNVFPGSDKFTLNRNCIFPYTTLDEFKRIIHGQQ
jgi:peptidoglycan/xylan/chitin deacetylase (PgdA/CDA1 family)